MTPAELLRKAAANITDETWCQFNYHVGGRSCAVGHLSRIVDDSDDLADADTYWQARTLLDRAVQPEYRAIASYNDEPNRTAAEVHALFLRVADELEAR